MDGPLLQKGDDIGIADPIEQISLKRLCREYRKSLNNCSTSEIDQNIARTPVNMCPNLQNDEIDEIRWNKLKEQIKIGDSASVEDKEKLLALIRKYHKAFAVDESEIGESDAIDYRINTGDALPIQQPLRRV